MDPCLFKLMNNAKLSGLLIVKVDDILSFGDAHHYQLMDRLQERFKFGKFKYIDQEPEGVGFNGRRIRMQGKDYLVDMQKFVEERLHEVSLAQDVPDTKRLTRQKRRSHSLEPVWVL